MFTWNIKFRARDYDSDRLQYCRTVEIVSVDECMESFKGHHESVQYLPSRKYPSGIKEFVLRQ